MRNTQRKWWLAAVLICSLSSVAFGHDRCKDHPRTCSSTAPEGGSNAIYLLGAGLVCSGAIFLRSKVARAS